MSLLRNIASGLRSLFRKEQVGRELDEELRAYQDMAAQEKMKDGMSRKDALRAVRLEQGSVEVTKQVPWFYGSCRHHPRPRHRRKHCNVQYRKCVASSTAPVKKSAGTCGRLENTFPGPSPAGFLRLLPRLPGLVIPEQDLCIARGYVRAKICIDRGGRAGASAWCGRDLEFLSERGRHCVAWAIV